MRNEKGKTREKETRNWKEGEWEGGQSKRSRERNGGRGEKVQQVVQRYSPQLQYVTHLHHGDRGINLGREGQMNLILVSITNPIQKSLAVTHQVTL